MIRITGVGSYLPARTVSNHGRAAEFGIDDEFIKQKLGVDQVTRMAENEETSDLCVQAYADLCTRLSMDPGGPDCLVVCTQNPDGHGIPHTSAVVHKKLGFREACACFDVSLGCSGFVYGLSIVKSFMESNGMRTGLLFTADPYSKIIDPADKNTAMLFGDGAAVTLLDAGEEFGPGFRPLGFRFATRGTGGEALHNRSGRLEMNGRAVFNFALTAVPPQISELLASVGVAPNEVDRYLLHQGSKVIVDQLARAMRLPEDKVPLRIMNYGNTVSSTLPLLLQDVLDTREVRLVVLSGFGVGLSWASCVLARSSS